MTVKEFMMVKELTTDQRERCLTITITVALAFGDSRPERFMRRVIVDSVYGIHGNTYEWELHIYRVNQVFFTELADMIASLN